MDSLKNFRKCATMLLCLTAFFSLTAFSCEDDDDNPHDPYERPVNPDRPDNNNYTGEYPYLYPLFMWNASPAQIRNAERHKLIIDQTNDPSEPGLVFEGEGDVDAYIYAFSQGKLKMQICGMLITRGDAEEFLRILSKDFQYYNSSDDEILFLSYDQTIACGITPTDDGGAMVVFLSLDEFEGAKARSSVDFATVNAAFVQVKAILRK